MTGEWPSYSSGEELLALVLICTAINQQKIVVMNIIIVLLLLLAILQWKEARRNAYNAYPYTYKLAIGKIVEQPRLPWPAVLSSDGSAWENAGTPHSTGGRRREILYSIPDCCRTYLYLLFAFFCWCFAASPFVRSSKSQTDNWDLRAKVIGKVATIAGSNSAWKLSPMFVLFFFLLVAVATCQSTIAQRLKEK